jgi:hypothetical protein
MRQGKRPGERRNRSRRTRGGRGCEESRKNSPERRDLTVAEVGDEKGGSDNGGDTRKKLGFRGRGAKGMAALKRGGEADGRGAQAARDHAGPTSSRRRDVAALATQSRGEQAQEKERWD